MKPRCVTEVASKDISAFFSDVLHQESYIVRGENLFTKENKHLNKLLGISGINKLNNNNNGHK